MASQSGSRAHWSTRFAFILAAAGSAIGLGNLWKFPYIAGINGGGAFVLVYLGCIFAVGLPIFIAELYIGQRSQQNAIQCFETLHRPKTKWAGIGWMGVLSAFLILSFYSVVGGWVLDFSVRSLGNEFASKTDEEIKSVLGSIFSSPDRQLLFHTIFMAITMGIVWKGITNGIERWNRILMPALAALLGFLFIRTMFLDGFSDSLHFLFYPSAEKLTNEGILEAVGHSFFTLSLGMGTIITYGSYLKKDENIAKIALSVAFLDTLIALVAGVVIFSVVFSNGLEPGGGPTLMFQTLPVLFSKMPGGYFVSVAFFLLVTFAAFTSAVSLLEVVVTFLVEKWNFARSKASMISSGLIYLLGILTVLSTNVLGDFKIAGLTFFDLFDKLTSSVFLPLGGCLIAIFYGWVLGPKAVEGSLRAGSSPFLTKGLLWTSRIIAPLAVAYVLFKGLKEWLF